MNEDSLADYISNELEGVDVLADKDDRYFYYDPRREIPHDRRMPFATLMTTDAYDSASNLSRPGVFRLNIGIAKETYRSLFGPPPKPAADWGVVETGHDYSVLGQVIP